MPSSFSFTIAGLASSVPVTTTPGAVAGETALRDEALDVLTGDLKLDAVAEQVFVIGMDGIASDVKARWQQVKGEWWLNLEEGVDWYGLVFVKHPDMQAIREEFIRVALTAPGCVEVVQFDPELNTTTRTLSVTYALRGDTGQIFGPVTATLSPNGGA